MEGKDVIESLDATGELSAYIKAHKWSVVADVCQRRLKKSNSGDALKVLRIATLALEKKASRKDQSKRELETLLSQTPAIRDTAALTLLDILNQAAHCNGALHDKLEGIWERAVAANAGNNAWVFKAWSDAKLQRGLLQGAKQAAMAWMKAFPRDHDPFFLFIFINDLISRSKGPTAAEQRLSQMLANKALATAAADTAAGKSKPTTGRILKDAVDLDYLITSYKRQSKYREALDIFSNPNIGLNSKFDQSSWEFALQKIELHGYCKEWEPVWQSCESILRGAQSTKSEIDEHKGLKHYGERGDDWTVWDAFMRATSELSIARPDMVSQAEELVKQFVATKSRNASLALLKLHSHYLPKPDSKKLLDEIGTYFERYGNKVACFREARPHLHGLCHEHQETLIRRVTQRNEEARKCSPGTKSDAISLIVTQVNALKLDYGILITRVAPEVSIPLLREFVETCTRLYDASILLDLQLPDGDAGPADDAILLAAMALIRLFHLKQSDALLRSIAVLEILLRNTRLHYEALLLVIQMYMYLGTGSLAIDRYAPLCVKNIQHASMPWLLFPRISKIHPWPVAIPIGGSATTPFNPDEEIRTGLRWYQSASKLMGKELDRSIHAIRLNTTSDLLETQELIQYGVGRLSLSIEERNLLLTRPDTSERSTLAFDLPKKVHDSRDLGALPNYEIFNVPSGASKNPNVTPMLKSGRSWMLNDILPLLSLNNPDTEQETPANEIENIKEDLATPVYGSSTPLEERTASIYKTLDRLLLLSSATTVTAVFSTQVDRLLKQTKELTAQCRRLITEDGDGFGELRMKEGLRLPLWYAFHGLFTIISISKQIRQGAAAISKNAEAAKHKAESYKAKLKEINSMCDQMMTSVRERATQERTRVGSDVFKRSLRLEVFGDRDDHLGSILEQSFGTAAADGFVKGLCDSYVDAYEGVVRSCRK